MKKCVRILGASGLGWATLIFLHCLNGMGMGIGMGMAWAQEAPSTVPRVIQNTRTAPAPALDKLLLSPAQRRALETARKAAAAGMAEPALHGLAGATTGSDTTPALPEALVISGTVTRAGNRSTVWVNNQPLYGAGIENPVDALAIRLQAQRPGSRDLLLKARPGQTIDTASRATIDALPPGAIRIIPPKISGNTATPGEP